MLSESIGLGGQVVGVGRVHVDGTEEFHWMGVPKRNRIVSIGLDHLLCHDGKVTGFHICESEQPESPALWLGNLGDHYGALTFCKIGTGGGDTEFTDTDLQSPVGGLSSTLRTGEPFCGTKCEEEGVYTLRVTHVSNAVQTECVVREVGLFGQYGSGESVVNPMFARVVLEDGVKLSAGERMMFTYDLRITYSDRETVSVQDFCGLKDSEGETLRCDRKICFGSHHTDRADGSGSVKYGDVLTKDLYVTTDGVEGGYTSNADAPYFFRLPPYYYNSVGTHGDFDTLGYSLQDQEFSVSDDRLSKARADARSDNYTFNVLDYDGVGNGDKHRDVTVCLGSFNPDMDELTDYRDIRFIRFRGMDYRFGGESVDSDTGETTWYGQSFRKWANQTMTFTVRTRYVTEDTYDMNGEPVEE